ncbi:MAG: hypothetical protein AUK03_06250 [Anaerolineae bacterium CG2_30_64_16]|nr:MAG: hypothetical protein AUK03_06250 [Anaerolineae bacterium CG2_30_64_16]
MSKSRRNFSMQTCWDRLVEGWKLLLRFRGQTPRTYCIPRTHWRFQDVGRALAWLNGVSEPGIYKVLKRLGFSRKQALHFVVRPDPDYHAKWRAILATFQEACEQPDQVACCSWMS